MSGRKKTPPPFSLRLTTEERAELERRAGTKPLGQFIREQCLGKAAQPRSAKRRRAKVDHTLFAQALALLGGSRLASNVNQIAKAAHIGALPVTPELSADLNEACSDIQAMRRLLMQALGCERASKK